MNPTNSYEFWFLSIAGLTKVQEKEVSNVYNSQILLCDCVNASATATGKGVP